MVVFGYGSGEGCTNPERQFAVENKFSKLASKTCGPSGWNLLHIVFKVHRILRWLLEFRKFVYP